MKIGERVENFILMDQHNNEFNLFENLDKDILLVFYPKDNTPVCTKQLVDYSLNQAELENYGIKIVGINIDPVDFHSSFCANNKIDFPILSDPEKIVSKRFKAISLFGQNKRKLVLINKDRIIKFEHSTMSLFFVDTRHIINELRKKQLI